MNLRRWFSAGSAGSVVVGLALCLGLVSAGITREAPIGQIKGKITMEENGRALPEAEVVLRPVVDSTVGTERAREEGLPRYRYARTEEDGTFRIVNVAAGKYMIEAYGRAHTVEPKEIEILEGKVNEYDVALKPREPSLDLYAGNHVFMPSEQVKWDLHGFVEADKVQIEVFKLRFDDVIREGTLYGALAPLARRSGNAADPATLGSLVKKEERPIQGLDVEGTFRLNLFLEPMPEGVYWVRCKVGELSQGTYFSISKLGLVLKRAGKDVLAFATKLDTGDPVPGVNVGFPRNGAYVSMGSTGKDGIARFRLPGDLPERNSVVIARHGSSTAFVDFYNHNRSAEAGTVYIYTDRPVYRPGDVVSYKGIVRKLVGSDYRIPAPDTVEVEIRDGDENLIENATLQTNANGSFTGTFKTNKESAPGLFRLNASIGDLEGEAEISIAAYRKPNYTVKVRPEKEHYVRGDKVRMIVECAYYFGGPVGGAKIQGSITRAPQWDFYDPDDTSAGEYDDYESEYGGEYFTDVEGVTDSSGKAVLEFDTRLDGESDESWMDSKFTLNASVADEAGAYFEGRGSVTVSAGDFSLISDSSHYVVEKSQPFDVTFETRDPGTKKALPGKKITVVAGYEYWDGLSDNFKPFARKEITTGSDGKATVVITPEKGGNLVVKAHSEDSHGNEITSENHIWCSSSGESYESHYEEKVSLRLDKKQYDPGEKAKLLIQAAEPGATALVTVEAEKIYKTQVVKLAKNLTTVDLPVLPAYAPNVYVAVCLIKDKQFHSRQRRLLVDLGKRTLQVEVKSDRETYKPGETATYRIQTKDANGRAAPAEVSLSVVDESIYAIREDNTDLEGAFYPKRTNGVETDYSFTTLYLDGGDKAPPGIEIRRLFKDTAFWQPFVQTDSSGQAMVQVKLPDNLTTWRATVQAVDDATAVGSAVAKAVARKPLMVRLQTPAFYVAGDSQRVAASVTNATGSEAEVNVQVDLTGATAKEGKVQKITLGDGETKALEWNITIGNPGEAVYTARAWVGSENDGVEAKVPILPRGRTEKSAYSGDLDQEGTMSIDVSPEADRTVGGVYLSLSPSLASPLFQSLDDLIDFPYGCVEQTMSRFMPAVVVSKVVQDLGLPKPRGSSKLPEIAEDSFARLKRFQHYDGGWGWWEYDESDARMTAYVLEGLYRAKLAGYSSSIDVTSTLSWSEKKLKEALPERKPNDDYAYKQALNERAYLAYALTLHGKGEVAANFLNGANLDAMSAHALALGALAYQKLGPDFVGRRNAALGRLRSMAKTDGAAGMSWPEDYWGIETTARCLQAIVAADPASPEIPRIIRSMMLARRGDSWYSTQDTAIGLLAISDYLKASKAEFTDSEIEILVNGKPLTTVQFTPRSIAEASKRIEIPMRLLTSGQNQIQFRKTGGGACFYSAELVQTIVQPQLPAYSNLDGVSIERSYHRLEQIRLEDGRMKLEPSKEAVTSFEPGDLVRCVVKITANTPLRYVQIEDPVPSNCRIVEREDLDIGDSWSYWWYGVTVRDDRVAYFAPSMSKGSHIMSYTLRAEQPGVSSSVPASVCEMYEPAKRAWSAVNKLEVAK